MNNRKIKKYRQKYKKKIKCDFKSIKNHYELRGRGLEGLRHIQSCVESLLKTTDYVSTVAHTPAMSVVYNEFMRQIEKECGTRLTTPIIEKMWRDKRTEVANCTVGLVFKVLELLKLDMIFKLQISKNYDN